MASKKRRFGRVRKLPSGRFQARYPGPDGVDHPAPFTFATKKEADRWLTLKEAEITRDGWWDPHAGEVLFRDYAEEWMPQRDLSEKTTRTYEDLLRLHLNPTFGGMMIKDITEADVRKWRAARLRRKTGKGQVPKAYRLMRAILNTAVSDRLIRENPCRIKGADKEDSEERPVLSVAEVFKVADAIKPRYRALVLLATFGHLRWGELAGLRRRYLDLERRTVSVQWTVVDVGQLVEGKPKSRAGRRSVPLPELIIDELRRHLDEYAAPGPNGYVFVGVKGNPLRRSNFTPYWAKACEAVGLVGVHFHDLRHTGNTYAAEAGASLRELMNRMGHSSSRAAMVYLHARDEHAREVADRLGERAGEELKKGQKEGEQTEEGDGAADDGDSASGT
ncbi:tyrosine-type recombinase/integrase [Marinitenerispora sediminis]|uniref:Site-specific integrase n=1 Tax=Marinitenerispora sediminis TaxID=1931232 RepID=A0A368T429_9ACTN|nr:site-specific integrase [Marinitenerispora sediminis]RCV49698.1 site-specific integrase [Marinitenerispora sediminis]RCV53336.1 site-specific integrase [Marinitenerispora sediminis]RCV57550.1 site-specific integrase [Marinitenerispora sediminis]